LSDPIPHDDDETDPKLAFEREKLVVDTRFREQELNLKVQEARRSRWANPLVIAVVGAALATVGNGVITWMSGRDQRELERSRSVATLRTQETNNKQQLDLEGFKAEAGRILEAIKTDNPDTAAVNLKFLLDTGLITNKTTVDYLNVFLKTRKPGQGPSLPAPVGSSRPGEIAAADLQQISNAGNTLGIDVSSHDRNIDYSALKAHGVSFVYFRASQAAATRDLAADEGARAAGGQGLLIGLYHIFDPSAEVADQIKNFKGRLKAIPWQLPPAIDVIDLGDRTSDKETFSRQIRDFAEAIEAEFGVTPILYTNVPFTMEHLDDSLHRYPLWLARYGTRPPTVPNGWSDYLLWQLADGVQDDPVLAHFDINAYRGSIDNLAALGRRK
jgi:lysozyme